MPLILLLLLLSGCVTSNPQPEDTRFDENKRNWLEIYRQELIIAQQNNDVEAWHFFIEEFVKEKFRLQSEREKKSKKSP